jgi:hypothetical protein
MLTPQTLATHSKHRQYIDDIRTLLPLDCPPGDSLSLPLRFLQVLLDPKPDATRRVR